VHRAAVRDVFCVALSVPSEMLRGAAQTRTIAAEVTKASIQFPSDRFGRNSPVLINDDERRRRAVAWVSRTAECDQQIMA
jgi:hypothetical protein